MTILESLNNPTVKQWMPAVLNTSALILLTASLAQWTWLFLKPEVPQVMVATNMNIEGGGSRFTIQQLLSAHLFGQANQEQMNTGLEELPISSLNLKLTGVIASGSGGYALIAVKGQTQEPFVVGDAITAGAVLQAVYPDRVVIMRKGAMESLLLEQPGSGLTSPKPANRAGRWKPPRPAQSIQKLSKNSFVVSRDELNKQIRGPDFLKQVSLQPLKGGGFLVRKIQPGSLYAKLGLNTGDVIQKINNQSVNNIDDIMRFYQQLNQLGQLQLEVKRAGKSQILNYRLE